MVSSTKSLLPLLVKPTRKCTSLPAGSSAPHPALHQRSALLLNPGVGSSQSYSNLETVFSPTFGELYRFLQPHHSFLNKIGLFSSAHLFANCTSFSSLVNTTALIYFASASFFFVFFFFSHYQTICFSTVW